MINGQIYVLSGPSGVGKSTVVKKVLESDDNIKLSISATTRAIREGEKEGVNYYFKTVSEFDKMLSDNQFMEWAEFCGNRYGTPKDKVFELVEKGADVILEIETQGAMKIMEAFPETKFIFIAPPSLQELEDRLRSRGTETEEVVLKRLAEAKRELALAHKYDYLVINNSVEQVAEDILSVIKAERFKVKRQKGHIIF